MGVRHQRKEKVSFTASVAFLSAGVENGFLIKPSLPTCNQEASYLGTAVAKPPSIPKAKNLLLIGNKGT